MNGTKVGFIGLGLMGKPMAASLVRAGFAVTVVPHRNPAPAQELQALGASIAPTAAAAAEGADFVVTMVPDSPQVEEVLFGPEGVYKSAKAGTVVIDMSTIAPSAARRFAAELAKQGVGFLDAPVSGGVARAIEGALTIMVGGEEAVLEKARPVLLGMGKTVYHAGATGAGQVAKACNNLLVGTIMMANSEMLTLGVKEGVKAEVLREIILASSGANWQLQNAVTGSILQDNYEPKFALGLLHKDLGIAGQMAKENGTPLFAGNLAHQMYGLLKGLGKGGQDFTAISTLYQDAANVTIATGKPRREGK